MTAARAGLPLAAIATLGVAVLAAATFAAAAAPEASAAPTESLYVIEQLVINVNSAPDASGERIATVRSGDRVEVIERQRDETHVRLANGAEGWIRASYLSAEEPLRARLAARESELAELHGELTRLQHELEVTRSQKPIAGNAPAAAAAAGAQDSTAPRLWPWVLGASLGSLLLGGLLGFALLDRHIRRKFGGLRIY